MVCSSVRQNIQLQIHDSAGFLFMRRSVVKQQYFYCLQH